MKIRHSARAILVNDDHEVLLYCFVFDGIVDSIDPTSTAFWVTPGGGLEEGEDFEACLRRELREEVGVAAYTIGPWVWTRRVRFETERGPLESRERYFLVRMTGRGFDPSQMTSNEKRGFRGARWFSPSQLLDPTLSVRPPDMGPLLIDLLAGALHATPVDIDPVLE